MHTRTHNELVLVYKWCFCLMKRQAVEEEGENSLTNKGILNVPEAACATTSIPPFATLSSTSPHPLLPPLFSVNLLSSASVSRAVQWTSAP